MSKSQPVSVRLAPELNRRIAKIAAALDRPKSWAIERAVEEYVTVHEWQVAAIEQGIRAADQGRTVPHDEVAAWVASWDRPGELPMPKCG